MAESEDLETPQELTADFAYLRLRKPNYTEEELTGISERIQKYSEKGQSTFAIFKHEESPAGPLNAEKILSAHLFLNGPEPAKLH